jgi:hypothetical protein
MTQAEHLILKLKPEHIKVGQRVRQDYGVGELQELADSIKEQGLIHPLTVDKDLNLIAGGRRFTALTTLLNWTEIPCYVKDCTSEAHLRMMELEENLRRKAMTWKEMVMGVVEVHRAHKREAKLKEETKWTQQMTGELLNISIGNVNYCLAVADYLAIKDHPIHKCESLMEALRLLTQIKEDEIVKFESQFAKEMLSTARTRMPGQPLPQLPPTPSVSLSLDALLATTELESSATPVVEVSVAPQRPVIDIPISKHFLLGDCCEHMAAMDIECMDHVITDFPYAIEMSNLASGMQNIERVSKEHVVEETLKLYTRVMPMINRVLRDKGFLVAWCDEDTRMVLKDLMEKEGLKVQRWSLFWVKTSACKNEAASYNFTKATECALVARKGNATLICQQPTNYWIGGQDEKRAEAGNPFVKPAELWRWILNGVAVKGQTIYDPFNGEGSCTLTAARAGYTPYGSEINELHYNRCVSDFKDLVRTWYGATHEINFI